MAIKKAAKVKRKEFDLPDIKNILDQPIKFKNRKFKFTDKQKSLLDLILNPENKIIFISGPAGTSKAQPLDADLMTPKGVVKMKDIQIGDFVFARNGLPTKVLGIFPQGNKDIFKVKFSDGTSTECCGDHLWQTDTDYDRNYRVKKDGKRFSLKRSGTVKTTVEIKNSLYVGERINHSIPICEPVNFETKDLFLHPYIMGILLGDGCLVQKTSFSCADFEIVEKIKTLLPEGFQVNKISSANIEYSIVSIDEKSNKITDLIRENNLNVKSSEKFIPNNYLFSDVNQRLELLRGLMDSDGTISRNKKFTYSHESFSSVSIDLINGVKLLVQSLGGTATISGPMTSFYYKDGEKIFGQDYYNLHINFNPLLNPFSLSRKANLYIPKTKYKPRRYIVDIEKCGQKECQCILIEDSEHLYLTNDFIVTHNTYISLYGALQIMQENKEKDLIYIRSIAESADKGLGSLPGDISEKFDPFLMPLYDKLEEIIHAGDVAFLKSQEKIAAAPINFLRGASWKDKLIVADEAQNFTFKELTTLITRIGEDTKIIICGDFMQSDINGKGGFNQMFSIFNDPVSESNGICAFTFNESDIVRSQILKFIIKRLNG